MGLLCTPQKLLELLSHGLPLSLLLLLIGQSPPLGLLPLLLLQPQGWRLHPEARDLSQQPQMERVLAVVLQTLLIAWLITHILKRIKLNHIKSVF